MEFLPDTPSSSLDTLSPPISHRNLDHEVENGSEDGSSTLTPESGSGAVRLRFGCGWGSCTKVFRRPSDLTKHQRYHIKEYPCDEDNCDKEFATQKDLKRHKRTHETLDGDSTGYRCRVAGCRKAKTGHVYNRRDNFIRHLRTKHLGINVDADDGFGTGG